MLRLFRVVIPLALMLGGILVIVVRGFTEHAFELGIPFFSAGASLWLFSFLWRVGVSGDRDRDVESDARAYFAEHGHWPDEAPGDREDQR